MSTQGEVEQKNFWVKYYYCGSINMPLLKHDEHVCGGTKTTRAILNRYIQLLMGLILFKLSVYNDSRVKEASDTYSKIFFQYKLEEKLLNPLPAGTFYINIFTKPGAEQDGHIRSQVEDSSSYFQTC